MSSKQWWGSVTQLCDREAARAKQQQELSVLGGPGDNTPSSVVVSDHGGDGTVGLYGMEVSEDQYPLILQHVNM